MRALKCLALCILVAGCASSSAEIKPSYVSPLQYQHLTCQQIAAEMERVSRRASEVAGVQDSNKTNDAWTTGAAIVLFWPAAFFIKGDGQTAAELARLKGEFEALEQVAIQKNCNLRIQRPAPAETSSVTKRAPRREEARPQNSSY
jgi:hypothetical protein